jgi:hypothetical protein
LNRGLFHCREFLTIRKFSWEPSSILFCNGIRTRDSNVRGLHGMVIMCFVVTTSNIDMQIKVMKVLVKCEIHGLTCNWFVYFRKRKLFDIFGIKVMLFWSVQSRIFSIIMAVIDYYIYSDLKFVTHFPDFENKRCLCYLIAVCVSVYVSVDPRIIFRMSEPIFIQLDVYHVTWAHLNDVFHKSLPSVRL